MVLKLVQVLFHTMVGLTRPVAAARAVLLQRERRVKLTHDTCLIRGSAGAQALFSPIRRRMKKKRKKKKKKVGLQWLRTEPRQSENHFPPPKTC